MHKRVIRHVYVLPRDQHSKPSDHLSLCKVFTLFLTIFSFYFSPVPLLWQPSVYSLFPSLYCVVLSVCFYWVFTSDSSCCSEWEEHFPGSEGAKLRVYLSLLGFCWSCCFISKMGTILTSPLCFIRDVVKRERKRTLNTKRVM